MKKIISNEAHETQYLPVMAKNRGLCWFFLLVLLITRIGPANGSDYEAKMDTLMQPLVEQGLLGGVILIAHDGKKVFEKGYGYADRENRIPNTPKTRFRISSITKIFSALAIIQLYEKGLLDIYKPVKKYFADLHEGDKITIFHLLTHTSGIPDYNWKQSNNRPCSLDQVYEWIKKLPSKFRPGTDSSYSNSGYVLLTMIIEKVSGMSYEEYLDKHIFSPLGLEDTGLVWMYKPVKDLARGYSKSGYEPYQPATRSAPLGRGDGDLYSTAADLLKLVNAFYSDRIVSKRSRNLMTTLHKGGWGIGWFIRKSQGSSVVYHPGGSPGYISNLRIYQPGKKILINLFNSDFLMHLTVDNELEAIALGKPFSPVFSNEKTKRLLKHMIPFLGEYRIDKQDTFKIFIKKGQFFFQEKGFPECPAYTYEKNRIYVIKNNYNITFIKDDKGFRFTGLFGLYYVEGPRISPE